MSSLSVLSKLHGCAAICGVPIVSYRPTNTYKSALPRRTAVFCVVLTAYMYCHAPHWVFIATRDGWRKLVEYVVLLDVHKNEKRQPHTCCKTSCQSTLRAFRTSLVSLDADHDMVGQQHAVNMR